MPEIQGQPFSNSESCHGVSFVSLDGSHELDILNIRGEYPEGPFGEVWAINERSSVVAKLAYGAGRIATRQVIEGLVSHEVTELTTENALYIPAGTPYAWQSNDNKFMKAEATFTPPFNPDYYHILPEADIQLIHSLREVTEQYLDVVDVMFVDEMRYDPDGVLSLVYERLNDEGLDPDMILKQYGIIEKGEDK